MSNTPIQYFRKEDFPELLHETWAQRLFQKLNAFSRQTQFDLNKQLSITDNLAAYWWEGNVYCAQEADSVFYPFRVPATIPLIVTRTMPAIKSFPLYIQHKLHPRKVAAILVAQAFDVTIAEAKPIPAMPSGVAWTQEGDRIRISAINGMITSATVSVARIYQTRLLVVCE